MSDRTRLGLGVLAAALVLGILSDALLDTVPWGLNVLLWVIMLAVAVFSIGRWQGIQLAGGGRWLILPALGFAAALAWRDSLTLGIVNILAVLVALTLTASRALLGQVRVASMIDFVVDAVLTAFYAVSGVFFLLFQDVRWREVPRGGLTGHGLAVARGLILGLPLLLCFGLLFMAADAIFAGMIENLFAWDLAEVIRHLFLIGMLAWVLGGILRFTLVQSYRPDVPLDIPNSRKLGIVEVGIVLGMLNALFLAFVIVQFRYFFGGADLVEASTSLTYAEYARKGFFELVTVAALMLPLLLAVDWVARKDNPLHKRLFTVLVVTLVALLFVVMASAFQRMRLYQSEFGMTELRLYTTVFMGWIGVVFLWFLATVMRSRRNRFAFGMLVTGFLAAASLNAINPDAFIVRINVNRTSAEQPLDARYVASLSADSVATLVELLPNMPAEEQKPVAESLLKRWSNSAGPDWRSWNWGRVEAASVVLTNLEKLTELASAPSQ